MHDIKKLTQELIEAEQENLATCVRRDTLIDVFRANFDLWTDKLFPILRLQKKNRYEYVAKILARGGYVISVQQVGLYLSKVRSERGTKKKYKKKEVNRDGDKE